MPIVLALDLALITGFAIGPSDGTPRSGSIKIGGEGMHTGDRGCAFQRFMLDLIKVERPDLIAYEAPLSAKRGNTNADSTLVLFGLAWQTPTIATAKGIPFMPCHLGQVRAYFLGHGRPVKSDDVEKAVKRACLTRGWAPKDHNAADALAVWEYAVATRWPKDAKRFALAGLGHVEQTETPACP